MSDARKILAVQLFRETEGLPRSQAMKAFARNPRLRLRSDEVIDEFRSAANDAIVSCVEKWCKGEVKGELRYYAVRAIENACNDALRKMRRDWKTEQYPQALDDNGNIVKFEAENKTTFNPPAIAELVEEHGWDLDELLSTPEVATVQPANKSQRRKLKYEDIQLHDLHYSFGVLEMIDGRMVESDSTQKQTAANERKSVTSIQRILDYVERATDDERQLLLLEAWGGPDEREI
jgi:hypothetical protein